MSRTHYIYTKEEHPIFEAILNDNPELLLQHIQNINNICDLLQKSPLHIACQFCKNWAVNTLLANDADTETIDNNGNTPLFAAVLGNNLHAVQKLLFNGANKLAQNKAHQTPLDLAKQIGNPNIINALQRQITEPQLAFGASVSESVNSFLEAQAEGSSVAERVKNRRRNIPSPPH